MSSESVQCPACTSFNAVFLPGISKRSADPWFFCSRCLHLWSRPEGARERVIRWSYVADSRRCDCELALSPDQRLYAFRVSRTDVRGPIVELFHHVHRALEHQSVYERSLLRSGYSLQSVQTCDRVH